MKLTALGVNSAFAVGKHKEVVDYNSLRNLLNYETGLHIDESFKSKIQSLVEKCYVPKWQSNFLLEFKTKGKVKDSVYRFVLDFGGDIRHALEAHGLGFKDIDGYYCSHPHNDHVGGLEGIALSTFFNPFFTKEKTKWLDGKQITDVVMTDQNIPAFAKPDLYAHRNVMEEIWRAGGPGLETLQGVMAPKIDTYFNIISMIDNTMYEFKDEDRIWKFYTIVSTHVISGTKLMPSYGLMFECSDGKKIYMPTDTMLMTPPQIETFYKRADVIFQDCETGFRSGVHAYIDDLRKLDPEIKKKTYLYHFNEEPVVGEAEFAGVLKTGQSFEF